MGYAPYFFPCTLEVSQNPVSCSASSAPWGSLIINGGSRGRRGKGFLFLTPVRGRVVFTKDSVNQESI